MRANRWLARACAAAAAILMTAGVGGCKSLNERYIALEVWKYEKCFGQFPPGFTPPGAAAAMALVLALVLAVLVGVYLRRFGRSEEVA